jgi:hypothetical protein
MARANRLLCTRGGQAGVLGVDINEGLELRFVRLDASEIGLDDVDRRQAPHLDRGGKRMDGQEGQVALVHGQDSLGWATRSRSACAEHGLR